MADLRRSALALCLIALSATRIAAQEQTDTVVELEPLRVFGSIASAGPAIGSGVPARISTIGGETARSWQPDVLAEALAREPGISLYDDLGAAYKPTIVSRGFAVSPVVGLPQGLSVFVDGVPVNEPAAGEVNFDLLPMEHAERVELLRGTAPILGPNSLGGALNIVTRTGPPGGAGYAEVAVGSHGTRGVSGGYGDVIGAFDWFAGVAWDESDGWRQQTGSDRWNALVNVGRSGERGGVRAQAILASSYARTAGSLPLSVYVERPDSNLTGGDFEDLEQLHVAFSGWRDGIAGGRAAARAWYRDGNAERFNVNQELDPDVRGFTDARAGGVEADWRRAFAARRFGLAGAIRFGASAGLSANRVQIFGERVDPGQTTDVGSDISEYAAFATADVERGRLTLSGALRFDRVRIPFEDRLDPSADTVSTYTQLSPRVGAGWRFTDALSAYASLGRAFRAPALIELACADPEEPCPLPFALGDDPPLDPVVVTTGEIGVAWTGARAGASIAAYRSDVVDDIFLFPYEDESEPEVSTIDGYFDNLARTRREGVEASLDIRLARVSLRAGYAFTRATFRADDVQIFSIREEAGSENEVEVGDEIPLVPRHTAQLDAELDVVRWLDVGAALRYVGERRLRGDEANEEPSLDPHVLADVRAALEWRDWRIEAVVLNALDREHTTFGTFNINQGGGGVLERFLMPGAPRTVRLTLRRQL